MSESNRKLIKIPDKVMRNFRLPVFIIAVIVISIILNKLFIITSKSRIATDANYSFAFFMVTLFIASIVVLKNIMDILSILFGQKGQNSLTDVAKRNNKTES